MLHVSQKVIPVLLFFLRLNIIEFARVKSEVKKRVWFTVSSIKNVLGSKDQLTFKVLLANRWSLGPEVGSKVLREKGDLKK